MEKAPLWKMLLYNEGSSWGRGGEGDGFPYSPSYTTSHLHSVLILNSFPKPQQMGLMVQIQIIQLHSTIYFVGKP